MLSEKLELYETEQAFSPRTPDDLGHSSTPPLQEMTDFYNRGDGMSHLEQKLVEG